ncbi:UDP-GlcNAc:undecaprenyl-phosphate GlcNAc-1-phosphate transferase [Parelusimicrobium proximum]|uniref:MraY family glycosyltransferase n=1 Tax=Parelusimicrobium proximum TaxID=3228953 RepID=UPI003D1701C2
MYEIKLYIFCVVCAFLITSVAMPLLYLTIGKYLLDRPYGFKNHAAPTPLIGGTAVAAGFGLSLIIIRFITAFPTGTLRSLRGIFIGCFIIYLLGLLDDIKKPEGLSAGVKLLGQSAAAIALIFYGIKINFLGDNIFSLVLTFFWIIGVTNAFNLLDIADGLCVTQAACAAFFFLLIALPSEQIYVNFAAAALIGACIGFWPHNHSLRHKAFLGDSGSMLAGFILAAIAMGTEYTAPSNLSVYVPLLILAVPLFDTLFVMFARIIKGKNPLKASNDHIVLRLKKLGMTQNAIMWLMLCVSVVYGCLGLVCVRVSSVWIAVIYTACAADMLFALYKLMQVKTDD